MSVTVWTMVRRLATSLVLVLTMFVSVSLSLGHAAAHPAMSRTAAPTVVERIRPVGPAGNLLTGYESTHSHRGAHCSAGSEATRSAYRCIAHNRVYDPCWVSANRAFVDCLNDPWGFDVVQLQVTKGYDNAGFSKRTASIPWGVQLANGQLCGLLQGATSTVHGRRVNYGCQHVKYVLVGNVDKHHKVWRIRKAHPTSGGHFKVTGFVDVTKAFFGKPSRKG
jgi:hypothetical protein